MQNYLLNKKNYVQFFTQKTMDKSKNKNFLYWFKCVFKWLKRFVFILFAAFVIGFTNAFNDEFRWINDARNFSQPEQVMDDEDTNE